MTWTKDSPKVSGYYWLRNYLFAESKAQGFKASTTPVIVHLYTSFGEPLSLTFTGNDSVSSLDDFAEAEWYGPLSLPTEGIDNWNMSPPRMANSKVAATFRDLPDSFLPYNPELQPFDMVMAGGFVVSFSMKTDLKVGERIEFWGKSYIVNNREEKDGFLRYSLTPEIPAIGERFNIGEPTKTMIEPEVTEK